MVKLDVIHHLQGEGEVTEENMHPEKANNAEVPKKAVEGALAIFTNNLSDLPTPPSSIVCLPPLVPHFTDHDLALPVLPFADSRAPSRASQRAPCHASASFDNTW